MSFCNFLTCTNVRLSVFINVFMNVLSNLLMNLLESHHAGTDPQAVRVRAHLGSSLCWAVATWTNYDSPERVVIFRPACLPAIFPPHPHTRCSEQPAEKLRAAVESCKAQSSRRICLRESGSERVQVRCRRILCKYTNYNYKYSPSLQSQTITFSGIRKQNTLIR